MLGVAIRIARRIGIHSESVNTKCTALEAEMRRRVWWSFIFFDARIGEMADFKDATLSPMFDCRPPLNVNDSDLRAELREPPNVQGQPTEAIFAVVRSELAEYVRHTTFHLDFTSPVMRRSVTRVDRRDPGAEGDDELAPLEKMIEEKYLRFCNPDNPLHFLTIWTTRYYIAKCRLIAQYWETSNSSTPQTDTQRDAALSNAFVMLESDTRIMNNPITKGYRWLFYFYLPFPAYAHALQDLRRRPLSDQAESAWEVVSDNFEARSATIETADNPLVTLFSKIVLDAWQAREQTGKPLQAPRIVSHIRAKLAERAQNVVESGQQQQQQPDGAVDMGLDAFSMSMPLGFGSSGLVYGQGGFAGAAFPNPPAPISIDVNMNRLNWAAMDWGLSGCRGW